MKVYLRRWLAWNRQESMLLDYVYIFVVAIVAVYTVFAFLPITLPLSFHWFLITGLAGVVMLKHYTQTHTDRETRKFKRDTERWSKGQ
jgi:uncharacterized RDD family membrane protein YckC